MRLATLTAHMERRGPAGVRLLRFAGWTGLARAFLQSWDMLLSQAGQGRNRLPPVSFLHSRLLRSNVQRNFASRFQLQIMI